MCVTGAACSSSWRFDCYLLLDCIVGSRKLEVKFKSKLCSKLLLYHELKNKTLIGCVVEIKIEIKNKKDNKILLSIRMPK